MADLESLPEHIRRPDLRPVQPVAVQRNGQQLVALRDPAMLARQTMIVSPSALVVLQHFRGEHNIEEIAGRLNGDVDQLLDLARGLDQVGLLFGPTFERLESEIHSRLASDGAFPPGASLSLGQDAGACRSRIEEWFAQTEDPELDGAAVGIVAPHLDYDRGWPNYAAGYYALRAAERPDRVVILGTNHFGAGEGVVCTEYAFDSPMGRVPTDAEVVRRVVAELGRPLVVDQLDHLAEHSIELQLPWLQYCFGTLPVVAALVPDPLHETVIGSGAGISGEAFARTLAGVLEQVGGRTFFVASSDLSHVGPQFGEPRAVDDQRRLDVEHHDRDMLCKYMSADVEDFLGAMRWTRNPTRWCSIGNMAALLRLARPRAVELIDYRQACDDRGFALVSSAAMVVYE